MSGWGNWRPNSPLVETWTAGPGKGARDTARSRSIHPHRDAGRRHMALRLADGVIAEMEDRRGEHRGRAALGLSLIHI